MYSIDGQPSGVYRNLVQGGLHGDIEILDTCRQEYMRIIHCAQSLGSIFQSVIH